MCFHESTKGWMQSSMCTIAAAAAFSLVLIAPGEMQAQETETSLPIVYVLATGGTIAGRGASATRPAEYQGAQLTGVELIDAVPELLEIADVRVEQIANVGSPSISVENWFDLANRINELFSSEEENVAGVVITHGTNTLEETAYFLHLTVNSDRPVVLVGAQRPATAMSADGPYNLYTAVRLAASEEARGMGAMIAMNEEINSARDVFKANTYRLQAFQSGELGVLGYIDSDQITFYRAPTRRHTYMSEFDISGLDGLPQVEIVYSYAQASGDIIRNLFETGVDGVVIAGSGAGGTSPDQRAAVEEHRNAGGTIPVVRSNRTMNGRVLDNAFSRDFDVLHADNLTPVKARILLMLALTVTQDHDELQRIMLEY